MNKLWDETELNWIKTISNSPKSSGHATQLSISFRNKANIFQKCSLFRQIWCGFVQLSQNLLCRNRTNWTEKSPWRKNPTNTQNASGVAKLLQVLWRRQPRQLGRKASLPVTPASSQMEKCVCVCVCSHPFICKCVTFQKKNLPRSERILYWMCFQSGWWRVKQRLQQAGTTTETMLLKSNCCCCCAFTLALWASTHRHAC